MNKKGFTLAEVLIVLGIIGVVAALTIPSLIAKYRRMTVEAKLKKFYSTMNQAAKLSQEDNEGFPSLDTTGVVDHANADLIENYYKNYILKYMQGVQYEKVGKGDLKVILSDGSGFFSYLQKDETMPNPTLWIMYCLSTSDDKHCYRNNYDGQNQFLFRFDTEKGYMDTLKYRDARSSCYNTNPAYRHACAQLIKENGWKIPDDYPWIK